MQREHTAEFFDLRPFMEADQLPTDPSTGNPLIQKAMRRNSNTAIWMVRAEPLRFTEDDGPLAWTLIRYGDIVRIPLLPYRTERQTPQLLLGAIDVTQRYVEMMPNAIRTHIIIGEPIQEVDDNYRLWIGFAAQLQE